MGRYKKKLARHINKVKNGEVKRFGYAFTWLTLNGKVKAKKKNMHVISTPDAPIGS
jgi:hypothetical protein